MAHAASFFAVVAFDNWNNVVYRIKMANYIQAKLKLYAYGMLNHS